MLENMFTVIGVLCIFSFCLIIISRLINKYLQRRRRRKRENLTRGQDIAIRLLVYRTKMLAKDLNKLTALEEKAFKKYSSKSSLKEDKNE